MKKIQLLMVALLLVVGAKAQIDTARLAKFAAKTIDTPDGVLHYREARIDAGKRMAEKLS